MAIYTIQSDRKTEVFVQNLRRRALVAVSILVSTVLLSTLGFVLLGEHEGSLLQRAFYAFWDTLNLVSTVGSLHTDLTNTERAWALLIIVVGLGAVLYGFGIMQNLLQSGEVLHFYARKKMHKTLENLSDHIVLCGYGGVGRTVAMDLEKAGLLLVVIDNNPEMIKIADEHGFLAIQGDCTDEETLRQAGVDRAAGLIATLDHDPANVYLILLAREQNPGLRIVSRAEKSESRTTLLRAGADRVIVPGEIAALQLSHLILKPIVSEIIAASTVEGDLDFAEIAVTKYPEFIGKSLLELSLPQTAEVIVISIIDVDGNHVFNPPENRVVQDSDTLLVVSKAGGIDQITGKA